MNDKLLNTLQLKKQALENAEHRDLIEASINQKIETLKPVSFPSAVNIRENNKYLKYIIPPAAIICILAFAAPSILTESTRRLIRHNEYFAPVAPFQFEVMNKSLSAIQGEDFKLELKLSGDKLPADVYIETASNTFKLDKENISRFRYLFSNLQQSTSFRLTGNGFKSAPYNITVSLKPVLLHFDAELSYPAYLHKKNETIPNAGDLTLPAGTVVIGLYVTDFHRAWPWSERRWRFVGGRMAELAAQAWHGDAAAIGTALQGAASVRSVAEPHLAPWLAGWADCMPAPALFPPVERRCDSFSQWWTRASRGVSSAADLLAINEVPGL